MSSYRWKKIVTAQNTSNTRVSPKIKNKIRNGRKESFNKINKETKKYEPSVILEWGISFY